MNAQDVAKRIIEKEEAYFSIDFASLEFEDKCAYVMHHNGMYHPLYENAETLNESFLSFVLKTTIQLSCLNISGYLETILGLYLSNTSALTVLTGATLFQINFFTKGNQHNKNKIIENKIIALSIISLPSIIFDISYILVSSQEQKII